MRFIVAQTDPSRLAGERCQPLPVGVVRWPGARLTLVVKGSYRYDPVVARQKLRLAAAQEALAATDLVAFKPSTDLLLVGHAFAPGPRERIDARVRLGSIDRVFCAVGTRNDRFPLEAGFLRAADGVSATDPVGPCGPFTDIIGAESETAGPWIGGEMPRDEDDGLLDWNDLPGAGDLVRTGGVSHAAEAQRCVHVAANEEIQLDGLAPGGEPRVLVLPAHTPIVVAETRGADFWVNMYCDTVTIDTAGAVTLVWRGQVPVHGDADDDLRRIVVSLERDDEELRPIGTVYRELQRGHYFRATELTEPEQPPEIDPELLLARYETWGLTPEPMLELESYAALSVALPGADDRNELLRRHDLDEDRWLLEEQAWMARLSAAVGADEELLRRYDDVMRAIRGRGA